MGKAEQGGPVNDLSGERADHGRSAPDFRVEQESGTKEGKQWTFERSRKVKRRKYRSSLLRAGETEKSRDGFFSSCSFA